MKLLLQSSCKKECVWSGLDTGLVEGSADVLGCCISAAVACMTCMLCESSSTPCTIGIYRLACTRLVGHDIV